MIPLGLRLALRGGRETMIRLVVLIVAVGLGTGLLLAAVSAINAFNVQNDASAWLRSGSSLGAHTTAAPATTTAPLWWRVSNDTFGGETIDRVDVAATGSSSPVPPGLPRDPGPGKYYASPALVALLRSTPADELADRYPGQLTGVIGEAGLQSPDSLVIVIGHSATQLARVPGAVRVTSIATRLPPGISASTPIDGMPAGAMDLVFSVIALAVLAPVLIFIGTATRLSAARREQRFAAMRLVGATRRQVSLIAGVESTVAAVGGMAVGFGIFFLLRVPLAAIPFTGQPFFPAQMSLSAPDVVIVALGVPVAAAVAARLALRRVHISPLGVTRRVTPKPPSAWRLLPLLAGIAELGFFVVHGHPVAVSGQVGAFVTGFGLIIVGLIIAGPWLTMAGARFMARRTSRPGALIAARRLADDPRAGFRAVSGLVLALFVTTVAAVTISTSDTQTGDSSSGAIAGTVVSDQFVVQESRVLPRVTLVPPLSPALTAELRGTGGVVEIHADAGLTVLGTSAGLVSCAQLARVPALGRCGAGADVAAFPVDLDAVSVNTANTTWPAERIPGQRLNSLRLSAIDVATNGSRQATARSVTVLEDAYPLLGTLSTFGGPSGNQYPLADAYKQLADVVILISLAVAGCTLAASIAGGLADRKRPFSTLRLTGARLATLRRVVALESAVPLLVVAAVAIGAGFGAAAMYASAEMHLPLAAPGPEYYLITAAGIAASLAIIAATFPLLRRITGPEAARNE
ncbi:MAG: FtsX-like permease family protein [Streptosporangiaceae bacterium]|jgi:hypothetical protein